MIGVNDLLALLEFVCRKRRWMTDGIWDSQDDCVGAYDEVRGLQRPGPKSSELIPSSFTTTRLYAEAIDEWWVYELYSDTLLTYLCENPGCMDPTADNYDPMRLRGWNSCFCRWVAVCDFESRYLRRLHVRFGCDRRPMLVCGKPAHGALRQRRCDSCEPQRQ